ncbi:MAG: hypothetical protein V4646_06050 [Pseudomonadota bacterium]
MEITVLIGAACAIASAVVTYVLTTHYHIKRVAASPSGEDHVLDLRLDREFQKGKEAGRLEELGNFTLTYEPFVETIEEYLGLKKRSTLGYDMQIHYSGFPIGHRTRHVTHNSIEYDEKRVDALLNNEVAAAVNGIVQLAASKGMGAKSLPRTGK